MPSESDHVRIEGKNGILSLFPPHLHNEFSDLCVVRKVGGCFPRPSNRQPIRQSSHRAQLRRQCHSAFLPLALSQVLSFFSTTLPHHTPPQAECCGTQFRRQESQHTRQTPTHTVCAPQLSYHQLCLLDSLYLSVDIHSRVNGLSHKSNVDHQVFLLNLRRTSPKHNSYTI